MKVDFNAIILNLLGEPMLQPPANTEPVTLAWVSAEALLRPSTEKKGDDKYKLFALALKIGGGGSVELKSEEVALIKAKVGEHFSPLIVGRAYDLLG